MNRYVDLIVDHIGQLCTIAAHDSGPHRGNRLGDLGLIENAAVAIQGEQIVADGPREAVLAAYGATDTVDAQGKVVTPGLIDPHTHLIWAGDRAEEFEQRIKGATYHAIMPGGVGANCSARNPRA